LARQDRESKHAKSKVAIGSHPLFPAIVALWFGALFGLGSIAIRPGLIEDAVLAAHIDTMIPAAAPPLGMTTRILLALAMAGLGGLIGAVLARRLSRPNPEKRERRRGAASPQEAVSPRQAYAPAPQPEARRDSGGRQKRRALTVDSEVTPLELRESAPLPGGPQILNIADIDAAQPDERDKPASSNAQAGHEIEPSDEARNAEAERAGDYSRLAALAETSSADPQPDAPPCALSTGEVSTGEVAEMPHRALQVPASSRLFGTEPESPAPTGTDPAESATISPFALFPDYDEDDDDDDDDLMQDGVRSAPGRLFDAPAQASAIPAPDRAPRANAADSDAADSEAEVLAETPARPDKAASAPPAAFAPPAGSAADRLVNADLDSLSPVELIERLAIRLQRRRGGLAAARNPAAPAPEPFAPVPPQAVPAGSSFAAAQGAGNVDDAGKAAEGPEIGEPDVAEIPAKILPPAAMRPLSFDDDDDADDDDVAAQLPGRHIAAPFRDSGEADDADEIAEALDNGYSSLLDLSLRQTHRESGGRQGFVRIEDPEIDAAAGEVEPVVVFPGQTGRSPAACVTANREPVGANPPDSETRSGKDREAAAGAAPDPAPRPFDNPALRQQPDRRTPHQDSAEAERALRSALATLQRMSGAA